MSYSSEQSLSCNSGLCFCNETMTTCEQYRKQLLKEKKFIFESNFDIKDNIFSIQCGLSNARNFQPAVKLLNKTDNTRISFNTNEWNSFLKHLKDIYFNYFESDNQETVIINLESDELISLQTSKFLSEKVLKITSEAELPSKCFYFSKKTIKDILNLSACIIKYRLEMLQNIDFPTFYNKFLDTINRMILQSNYELHPEQVITSYCEILGYNLESYCLRECWFYYKDHMMRDLDNISNV